MKTMSNLMRTNTKEYRTRIYKYILDCIYFEDIAEFNEDLSDKDKINYFFAAFNQEYVNDYNKKFYKNEQDMLASYISGLPSCFNIDGENYRILEVAKELHNTKKLSEKEEDTILENWFLHIAYMLLKLKDKLNK